MKKRLLFVLCSIFVAANLTAAQTKTVTNSDLEKYRQKRLQAERDYRENYAKLGFPSPEELERQIEQAQPNAKNFQKGWRLKTGRIKAIFNLEQMFCARKSRRSRRKSLIFALKRITCPKAA